MTCKCYCNEAHLVFPDVQDSVGMRRDQTPFLPFFLCHHPCCRGDEDVSPVKPEDDERGADSEKGHRGNRELIVLHSKMSVRNPVCVCSPLEEHAEAVVLAERLIVRVHGDAFGDPARERVEVDVLQHTDKYQTCGLVLSSRKVSGRA